MFKLIRLTVSLVVILVGLGFADVFIRHRVERAIAQRIELNNPGSTANVSIHSWPFVWHLLQAGSVSDLKATVTGMRAGVFPIDTVNLDVENLKLSQSQLLQGRAVPESIRLATVTAVFSQRSIDTGTGLPVTLGQGTVGLNGLQVAAQVSAVNGHLSIAIPPLPALEIPLPASNVLPCSASAVIIPGQLDLTCTTTEIPPGLQTTQAG